MALVMRAMNESSDTGWWRRPRNDLVLFCVGGSPVAVQALPRRQLD